MIHRMPPKGATNPSKAKAAAALDVKQKTLGFAWALSSKLPSALPTLPVPLRPALAPKIPSPSPPPDLMADASIKLQVHAVLHSMIDTVIVREQRAMAVIKLECKSLLNDMIDRVIIITPGVAAHPFMMLKTQRKTYGRSTKARVVGLCDAAAAEGSMRKAVKRLNEVEGFEKVSTRTLRKWGKSPVNKKRGVKVNCEFEAQIIGQLIYSELEDVDGVELALIKANVAHSYAVIQRAAQVVQALPQFLPDEKIQKLKFTRSCVGSEAS